jgi:hypothetical protein
MARHFLRVRVFVVASGAIALACGDPENLTPPAEPPPTYTLSGVITERSTEGARPSAGAHVAPFFWISSRTLLSLPNNTSTVTDSQGRYAIRGLPSGVHVQLRLAKSGYVQQCASPRLPVETDLTRDEQLVAADVVMASASSVPAPAPGYRLVSGIVYGPDRQPVVGAPVTYELMTEVVVATTRSDNRGRYLLCGLPEGSELVIGAESGSLSSSVIVPPGGSTDQADIVLGR